MTEVTAIIPSIVEAPKADRPKLPEGVKYLFDDCDTITITDVSGAPEGAFSSDNEESCGYTASGGGYISGGMGYTGIVSAMRGPGNETYHYHFYRQPALATYTASVYVSENPANFAVSDGNPWRREAFFRAHFVRTVEHMIAPSEKHPGLLMYFQSPEKRARDIRTPIKPGKYLTKFFSDVLTGEEINDLAVKWTMMSTPPKAVITQDADEIERVYKGKYNGSCMHFANDGYEGSQHPARAYAGPDLGTAYIGDIDNADGRCLVWPEKKIYYPKFYGDYRRMEQAMTAIGYRSASEDEFEGARLQRIQFGSRFVAPYLDVCGAIQDDGEYLKIAHEGIPCRETDGLSGHTGRRCAYYGGSRRFPEDEMTNIPDYGWVCEEALDNGPFAVCALSGEYAYRGNMTAIGDDEYIRDDIMHSAEYRSRWFRCDRDGGIYLTANMGRVTMYDGEVWAAENFDIYGSTCQLSGENYPDDEVTILDNGKVVADSLMDEEDEDYRAFAGLDPLVNEDAEENEALEAA
ncbi:hypothetical protein [Rhizobium sp. Leaf341]|uniref:hypothetical protein n=1 Tax=Rhizobium sp. Leaf341 TaxID=1736344 RepID=UPI00138F81BF|nr:hypothetical protein [Rhizobium sp. Leaf341]